MVFVEGGTFKMGSDSIDDSSPIHSVTLSSFYIGKYEVTQGQWNEVMGSNPSFFKYKNCESCPIENVQLSDIQDFIRLLNIKTGKSYRLPTEAEWEYAARGGKLSKGFLYSGSNNVDEVCWHNYNCNDRTHNVGELLPNELGIYDMSGNVSERCSDVYVRFTPERLKNEFSEFNPTGPRGPSEPGTKLKFVVRGSDWRSAPGYSRSVRRDADYPTLKSMGVGFRLVLPVEDESKSEIQTETIKSDEEPLTYVEEDAQYPEVVQHCINSFQKIWYTLKMPLKMELKEK
jgi:formylglycine-generating enzyme required for sulfatase activity